MATQAHPPHTVMGAHLVTRLHMHMHRYELKHAGRQMQCRSQGQTCMHEHTHSHMLIHKCTCKHKESPSPLLYLTAPGWGGGSRFTCIHPHIPAQNCLAASSPVPSP